jgi:hypothetical protein
MDEKHALYIFLALTKQYDIPGQFVTLDGLNAYGKPITEKVPLVDLPRLERDAERILMGKDQL